MNTINIAGSEVRKIYSIGNEQILIPMMDDESTTAQVVEVDMDGYKFPALAISMPGQDEAELLINLETQMVLELIPTKPYQSETDVTKIQKAELETIYKKAND